MVCVLPSPAGRVSCFQVVLFTADSAPGATSDRRKMAADWWSRDGQLPDALLPVCVVTTGEVTCCGLQLRIGMHSVAVVVGLVVQVGGGGDGDDDDVRCCCCCCCVCWCSLSCK